MFSFKRQTGNKAENIALQFLKKNGLTLVEQNYLTKCGEIDIIMLDKSNENLVFVEVRYRKNSYFCSATDTVNHSKQAKLIRTAKHFLQKHSQYDNFICRFDVIGLESDLKCPKINWIKNAFEAL
ncbi:Predicted endonuclease distantly related to archaeal Holliday junction resolvase [uncultured Candidatus Thioglobus sp.]|nr:Predicted endonuclease distantly related to archaeal Holliday junction resolvase [uncultured Candidatus Thioglobus sp.]